MFIYDIMGNASKCQQILVKVYYLYIRDLKKNTFIVL